MFTTANMVMAILPESGLEVFFYITIMFCELVNCYTVWHPRDKINSSRRKPGWGASPIRGSGRCDGVTDDLLLCNLPSSVTVAN